MNTKNTFLKDLKHFRIAYITENNPEDRHAWSGTAHFIYKTLQKYGHSVDALGPAKPKWAYLFLMPFNQLSLKLCNKRFDYRHSKLYSKAFGKIFSKKIKLKAYDVVVVCGGTEYGAYIKTNLPKIYIVDRVIAGTINYHSILTNLWSFSKNQSIATDKKAMEEAALVVYSSEWAKNQAIQHYKISENKTKVLPFGANLNYFPNKRDVLFAKNFAKIHLLCIATNWKNKGVDIAVNAVNELNLNNISAHLTVVGSQAPANFNNAYTTVIPFLDKNTNKGLQEISALYTKSHFFILPTRFDCTPIVICEASAYAVPVICANTGGVEGHLKNDVNGYLINYNDVGVEYAHKIIEIINNNSYLKLQHSTRELFDEKLNWKSWAVEFTECLIKITK
ncbi:MAG: glycosyltransferase family 4 protein [Bacteroidetes bacterium]|nr:glycosyltransferase family 4 protein [Bacteroidota bacterium]